MGPQSNEQHVNDISTSLSSLGQEVVESFTKAIDACKNGSTTLTQQIDPFQLRTQQERFRLWAVNLGLFSTGHGALQYRLRDADFVCGYIGKVLSELFEDLTAVCDILLEIRLPFESQIDEVESQTTLEESTIVEGAENTYDGETVSDLSVSTEEPASSVEAGELSELGFRLGNIVRKVDTIFNIAYKIRGLTQRSYRSNAELYGVIPVEDLATHIEEKNEFSTAIVSFIFREELLERQRVIEQMTTKDEPVVFEDTSASIGNTAMESRVDSLVDGFCKEQHWLLQRLGRAFARREQQFIYWSERAKHKSNQATPHEREELPVSPEGRSENEKSRTISHAGDKQHARQSTTAGTTLSPQNWNMANNQVEEPMSSAGSFVSKLASVRHVQVRTAHWPDPPTILVEGNFFVCPMCKTICPKDYLHDKWTWRSHLVHDLQPYMCTYAGCPDQDKLYGKLTEWLAHEAINHRRVWICQKHPEIEFGSRNKYLQHLDAAHAHGDMDLRLPHLVETAAQPSSKAGRTWPFCAAEVLGAAEMQNHVAAHLERYSILALPKLNEHGQITEEEAESDSAVSGGLGSRHGDFEWGEPVLGVEQLSLTATTSPDGGFLALADLKERFTKYTQVLGKEDTAVKLRNFVNQLPDRFAENSHDFKPILSREALPNRSKSIDDQSTFIEFDKMHVRDQSIPVSGLGVLGGVSAVIAIIDASMKVWDSSRKNLKLTPTFKTVVNRLPILRDTLQTFSSRFELADASIPGDTAQALETVRSCKSKAEKLHKVFAETIPGEESQWNKRYRAVIQKLGKGRKVEELIEAMTEDVQNLVSHHAVKSVGPELIGNMHRGRSEMGVEMHRRVLVGREKVLGPNHPDTLASESNLAAAQSRLDSKDNNGQTLLSWAAGNGHDSTVRKLLEKGDDPESKDNTGRTPLSWAAEHGRDSTVKILLEKGADLEPKDDTSRTPLSWAAAMGHEAVVKLLAENGAAVDAVDKGGRTPLSWTAEHGSDSIFRMLLEKGADPNSRDNTGRTPLSWAAERGRDSIVTILLEIGAYPDEDKTGRTPLSWAAERGRDSTVTILLEKGAYPGSRDKTGRTPLSWAAEHGRDSIVTILLEKGADPDFRDKTGRTPLSWAAEHGRDSIVTKLLEKRAYPDYEDKTGRTPLSWATEHGSDSIVTILLEIGAYPGSKDNTGRTPLSWAAAMGHKAVVKLLIENGAAVDSVDEGGQTPLSWAAEWGHEAVVRLLVENGAAMDSVDEGGQTPLSLAAEGGYEAVVKLLVENGAAVDSVDKSGQTPLSLAAEGGCEAVVKLLVENGAAVDSVDEDGRTPLSWAAAGEYKAVVKLLIENGAALDSVDEGGRTPLSWAAERGHEAVVKLLIENGTAMDSVDEGGQTPLSLAAEWGHEAVVKLLVENGAYLDSTDITGQTPLSWAVRHGHDSIIKILLEKGADPDPIDNAGRTPLSWAAEYGHDSAVTMLLRMGADPKSRDINGQTPLSWAAERGSDAAVKLLLKKEAKEI